MSLKEPAMDGSAGTIKRCCQGANKFKLYDEDDPCEGDLKLSLENGECRCVECITDNNCVQQGYSSCYVCDNGQCVKGPMCCTNLPGTIAPLGCYADPDTIDTETSCCVNFYYYYVWEAPARTSVYGYIKDGDKICNSNTGDTRRFYVSKTDCESFVVIGEERTSESKAVNITCGCPKGKYKYRTEFLWLESPGGMRQARGWCYFSFGTAKSGLSEKYGPEHDREFGGGCWWNTCYGTGVKWTIGDTGSGSLNSVNCRKNQSAFSQVGEEPTCIGVTDHSTLGTAYPDNTGCLCSGSQYALMEQNEYFTGWCGICNGKAKWVDSINGCLQIEGGS